MKPSILPPPTPSPAGLRGMPGNANRPSWLHFGMVLLLAWLSTGWAPRVAAGAAVIWKGPAVVGSTNWATGANWSTGSAPGASDAVLFLDGGAATAVSNVNNVVDANCAISSLQYGNSNGFHTTWISNGVTLSVTGATGLLVFTPGDAGTRTVAATLTGAGTLVVSNSSAVLAVNQGAAGASTTPKATLNLSGLDTFNANLSRIGLGTRGLTNAGGANTRCQGTLYLARTNRIRLGFIDTLANYQLVGTANALELSRNNGNPGGPCALYLGLNNALFLDSLGVGMDKASAAYAGWMGFNPAFASSGPTVLIRGPAGGASRVTWWAIGDPNSSASISQVAVGTNDFSGGSVDVLVDTMSLARDCGTATTAYNPNIGVLTFTSGILDVNTLYVGNQWFGTNNATTVWTNACIGIVNVIGPNATLVVNSNLALGSTRSNNVCAHRTSGTLRIVGGTVRANTLTVGAFSTNNLIAMANGTLSLSNTLASPARGLPRMALTNSTLQLNVLHAATNIVVTNLTTSGTVTLQVASAPIFPTYPTQVCLIKYYSSLSGSGFSAFTLGSLPANTPGAWLSNNTAKATVDLVLPSAPLPPVITLQPTNTGFVAGQSVSLAVGVSPHSATPLSYRWYLGGVGGLLLADGFTEFGSIISGATTATLTIQNAQPEDAMFYAVVVSNALGSATSSNAFLLEKFPSATALASSPNPSVQTTPVTFTATVYGSGATPSGVVTFRDGAATLGSAALDGAGQATFVTSSLTLAASPHAITAAYGGDNLFRPSDSSSLSQVILPGTAPTITSQPSDQTASVGDTVTFAVAATGSPAPTYQWRKNGADLLDGGIVSGTKTSTLRLMGISLSDAGSYSVLVSNINSTATSRAAVLQVPETQITVQPVGQVVNTNSTATFSVTAVGTALTYQWRKNGSNLGGQTGTSLVIASVQVSDAGYYDVVVSGTSGSVTSTVAVLTVNMGGVIPSLSGAPYSLFALPDGKVLFGGSGELGCLKADGSDEFHTTVSGPWTYYDPYGWYNLPGEVDSVAVQPDGKIIVGGYFQLVDVMAGMTNSGTPRGNLARFNPDGSLDNQFTSAGGGHVQNLLVQSDGRVLVSSPNNVARYFADGTFDTVLGGNLIGDVMAAATRPNGQTILGGRFTTTGAFGSRSNLVQLNADGSVDAGFLPNAYFVNSLVLQPDGKLLVSGLIQSPDGRLLTVTRLNEDFGIDGTFSTSLAATNSGPPSLMVLQADGNILVGGAFAQLGGVSCPYLARLDGFGNVDLSFIPNPNNEVYSLALQADGRVLVGGRFTAIAGLARNHIAELPNTGNASQALSFNGATITWQLSGCSPALGAVVFDYSPNGTDWVSGVTGSPNGYNWTASLSRPMSVNIRARGWVNSGGVFDSGSMLEQICGPVRILQPPVSVSVSPGATASFSVVAASDYAISYQWRKEGVNLPGQTRSVLTIPNAQLSDAAYYDVVVSDAYRTLTSPAAALSLNGTFPDDLVCDTSGWPMTMVPQAEGSLLLGGTFLSVQGQPRPHLARLNSAGLLDGEFQGTASNQVACAALQPDGKLIVGGWFTNLCGQPRIHLGRLNPDGSLDTSFVADAGVAGSTFDQVSAITIQPDGTIIVGGYFATLNGSPRASLAALRPDGTLDSRFAVGTDGSFPQSSVFSLAVDTLGRVLVGGSFNHFNHQPCGPLVRLLSDGSTDSGFTPTVVPSYGVTALAVQADGRIVVGGWVPSQTSYGDPMRGALVRLDSNGNLDAGFHVVITNSWGGRGDILTLALQTDGSVLVGGNFNRVSGIARSGLARLNSAGRCDPTFDPAGDSVFAVALQDDGKLLVGGYFSSLGGVPRQNFGRLSNLTPATQSLTASDGALTWLRSGSCPELSWTVLDYSTNGTDWVSAGPGKRIAGGWQVLATSAPSGAMLRVRGAVAGGHQGGSTWQVQALFAKPLILSQPQSRNNAPGTTASFTVTAAGPGLSYQWFKASLPLADGGNLSGAQGATLQLTSVSTTDQGGYSVVISNSFGSVTSAVATLTVGAPVAPPAIDGQPTNMTVAAGAPAEFRVRASGAEPLDYQWYFSGGLAVPNATATVLAWPNVDPTNAGDYFVVVSNPGGSVTSQVATLVVGFAPLVTTEPTDLAITEGEPAAFSVTAIGTAPLAYQWRRIAVDGTNLLAGATSSAWTQAQVSLADRGFYRAEITNLFGAVTSRWARLEVLKALKFLSEGGSLNTVSNHIAFCFTGQAGTQVVVERCLDMTPPMIWIPVSTNTLGASPTCFTDPAPATNSECFYRLRTQ